MALSVKVCGLTTADTIAAAVDGGADFVGFVFFAPSPRAMTPERATALALTVPARVRRVGLIVDASDDAIGPIVATGVIDVLQLHGAETPARVAEVRERFGLPVIKAIAVASARDLDRAQAYEDVADGLLFDGRPPPTATRPGGNACSFDWALMAGRSWRLPWMLAGGLTAETLAKAVRASGAGAVDVSSGVETAPGIKSVALIRRFLATAGGL